MLGIFKYQCIRSKSYIQISKTGFTYILSDTVIYKTYIFGHSDDELDFVHGSSPQAPKTIGISWVIRSMRDNIWSPVLNSEFCKPLQQIKQTQVEICKNLQSIASWSEAQVITWACNWHPKEQKQPYKITCGIWHYIVSELSWTVWHLVGVGTFVVGVEITPIPIHWNSVLQPFISKLRIVGGNVNWYRHYGEQYGSSLKN